MARAESASASAHSDSIKGLAQAVARPAYRRLLTAEPFLRRAVPVLIVAFLATLDRVRALTRHPAFSLGNPNRVRALIGGFAQANPTQFNRLDGNGYDFVAETVLALDPKNPQVAARMTTAFRSWRALEPVRRGRAEAALRRIAAESTLSRDLRDIAARSLAERI